MSHVSKVISALFGIENMSREWHVFSINLTKLMSRLMTKPTKWPLRPVKTQINLGVCPVWLESLLSAWRNIGSSATHWAHCEDWSDCADAQADLSLRWVLWSFCWICHEVAEILSQGTKIHNCTLKIQISLHINKLSDSRCIVIQGRQRSLIRHWVLAGLMSFCKCFCGQADFWLIC